MPRDVIWREKDQQKLEKERAEVANKRWAKGKIEIQEMRNKYISFLEKHKGSAFTLDEIISNCGGLSEECGYHVERVWERGRYNGSIEQRFLDGIVGLRECYRPKENAERYSHPNISCYCRGQEYDNAQYYYWKE